MILQLLDEALQQRAINESRIQQISDLHSFVDAFIRWGLSGRLEQGDDPQDVRTDFPS